jgi:hypothetical protein
LKRQDLNFSRKTKSGKCLLYLFLTVAFNDIRPTCITIALGEEATLSSMIAKHDWRNSTLAVTKAFVSDSISSTFRDWPKGICRSAGNRPKFGFRLSQDLNARLEKVSC